MTAPIDPTGLVPQVPTTADQRYVGWEAFTDLAFMGEMSMVMISAIALSAVVAYHPAARRKAWRLEQFEHPKTFIMYALVASVIALIVRVQPSMALVVFGIGGLLRFRTNVGEAKDTGRVILVTVTGLCCGLQLFVIAVLATVFGWVLIHALEVRAVERVMVQGLDAKHLGASASSYTRILKAAGCTILGEEKNGYKGTVAIVYRTGPTFDRERIDAQLAELPAEERGAVDWQAG
ncbi:MAG: hypothetical protein JKY37_29455 [Nannocystaceae bacterium]|nr:hypothetical protein [Nannocystaceae bacterium]